MGAEYSAGPANVFLLPELCTGISARWNTATGTTFFFQNHMPNNPHGLSVRRIIKTPAYRIIRIADHQHPEGKISRWAVERKDAVAVIIHNTDHDTLVLTRQPRLPLYKRQDIYLLEIPAGVMDAGEKPEEAARREADEETGYRPMAMMPVARFFTSPGYTTEQMYLYYAAVTDADRVSKGGGMEDEQEYIQVTEQPVDYWFEMLEKNEIHDAKTLIALQWLAMSTELVEVEDDCDDEDAETSGLNGLKITL